MWDVLGGGMMGAEPTLVRAGKAFRGMIVLLRRAGRGGVGMVLVAAACGRSHPKPAERRVPMSSVIQGEWKWLSSEGGALWQTVVPGRGVADARIGFAADGGYSEVSEGCTSRSSYTFTTSAVDSTPLVIVARSRFWQRFVPGLEFGFGYAVRGDTLELLDLSSHPWTHRFLRAPPARRAVGGVRYGEPVTLSGTIDTLMRFGPPNFGEDPMTDERATVPVLRLATPIQVIGVPGGDQESERDVSIVQLAMPSSNVVKQVGRAATACGTLAHGFTGHHFTPVLLETRWVELDTP